MIFLLQMFIVRFWFIDSTVTLQVQLQNLKKWKNSLNYNYYSHKTVKKWANKSEQKTGDFHLCCQNELD